MSKEAGSEITITSIQFGTRLSHVILPYDQNVLEMILVSLGYAIETRGVNVAMVGNMVPLKVGKKEDIEFHFNNDRQVFSIRGTHGEHVISGFMEISESLESFISPSKLKNLFYESGISAVATASKSPIQVFSEDSNKINKQNQFDNVFEQSLSQSGLRLTPSNTPVDDPNWFEFRVEPLILQSTKLYNISFIKRNEEMTAVAKAIKDFENLTRKVLKVLEG